MRFFGLRRKAPALAWFGRYVLRCPQLPCKPLQPEPSGSVGFAKPKAFQILGQVHVEIWIPTRLCSRRPGPPQLAREAMPRQPLLDLAGCLNHSLAHRRDHGKVRRTQVSIRVLGLLFEEGFLSHYSMCPSGLWVHFGLRRVGSSYSFRRCIAHPTRHSHTAWVDPQTSRGLLPLRNSYCLLSSPTFGFLSLTEARYLGVPGQLVLQLLL